MQFTLVAFLSLVAVAIAGPIALPDRVDDIVARSPQTSATPPAPAAEAAAMTDAQGNVVAFDSASVYLAAAAAGQKE